MADHGTPARARQHCFDGELLKTCEPCRAAWAAYSRKRRKTSADRGRIAMRILRERHRLEYLDIMFQLRKADDEQHQ